VIKLRWCSDRVERDDKNSRQKDTRCSFRSGRRKGGTDGRTEEGREGGRDLQCAEVGRADTEELVPVDRPTFYHKGQAGREGGREGGRER